MRIAFLLFFSVYSFTVLNGQQPKKVSFDYFEKAYGLFFENMDSSIYYFKKGIDYYPSQNNWEKYVNCLNALASAYGQKGNYNQSYDFALQAYEAAEMHLEGKGVAYGSALNNFAFFNRRKGNYEGAIPLYQKALELEKTSGKISDQLVILNNLGNCFARKGDIFESKKHYSRAIHIGLKELGNTHPNITASFLDLAKIYENIGQPDTAYIMYKRALNQVIKLSNRDVRTQNQLISIHLKLGEFFLNKRDQLNSQKHIQKVISYTEDFYKKKSVEGLILLGELNRQKANYPTAIQNFKKALLTSQNQSKNIGQSTEIGYLYFLLAETYFDNNKLPESLNHYQKALEQYSKNFKYGNTSKNPKIENLIVDTDILKILTGKAKALFQKYKQTKEQQSLLAAKATYQLAIQLLNKLRQSYIGSGSKEILAENVLPIFEGALNCVFELHKTQPNEALINEAFQIAENNKAILLLEAINENNALGSTDIPEDLLKKERELKLDIAYHQKQLLLTSTDKSEKIQAIETGLFDLEKEHQKLLRTFEKDYPKYHQLKYSTNITSTAAIRKKIGDTPAVMLEYFVGKEYLYTFSINSKKNQFLRIKKPPKLNQQVQDLRDFLTNPPTMDRANEDFETFITIAHSLYQSLLAPIQLEKNIQQLILIPDDLLSYIPFEVLIHELPPSKTIDYSAKNLNYLVNNFQISYNYSATLFARDPKSRAVAKNDFIGFAPSFGNENTAAISTRDCIQDELYSLACNKEEVQKINQIFNGKVFLGTTAKKENFLNNIKNSRIAHLATHSCLDDKNPMLNKIFLSDDYLSNFDLYNLQLNTELAVLSACNTGNGQLLRGEGVMSLSRGFMHAGCPSVLMSLWSVEDCTTSDIMTEYYRGIKEGKTKDAALQASKNIYLAKAGKLEAHPFFWAPFVQFGSTEAMAFNSPWMSTDHLPITAAVIGLIVFLFFFFQKRSTIKMQ